MAAVRSGEVSSAGLAAGALCNVAAGSITAQGCIRAAGGVSALVGLLKRGALEQTSTTLAPLPTLPGQLPCV